MLGSRTCGLAVSVALHAAVGLVLSQAGSKALPPPRPPPPQTFELIKPPARPVPADDATPPTNEIERPTRAPESPAAIPAAERLPQASGESPETETTTLPERAAVRAVRPIELLEARRQAVEDALAERDRERSYKSFTFPGTLAEQDAFDDAAQTARAERGLQQPLTAFDSPSKGRAGLTETTAAGQYVRWISDDCYQTAGAAHLFALPATAGLYNVPMSACTRPRPRGDLFETAKPAYLMDADERAAADAEFERRDRLRRPTTGAVMAAREE